MQSVEPFENPMGIDGFGFLEYASPEPEKLHALFKNMGFTAVAKHKSKNITLYRQGDINFMVNEEPQGFAAEFAKKHGPCACGFAIRFEDAKFAHEQALKKGAEPVKQHADSLAVDIPAINGIGDAVLYLMDEYGDNGDLYQREFDFFEGVDPNPKGFGCTFIDHLTHNVFYGNMDTWYNYYQDLFNFREIRYFDIKGAKTGLLSRALTAPDGMVRIPLNESSDEKSQIVEYLNEYNGEGIQHIALYTDDIFSTIDGMREQGIDFLDTPETYYEVVEERIPNHGENIDAMRDRKILIDGSNDGNTELLLQIFTKTNIGPIFFEIIQRKGNEGFGEGNFKALFEAIERDQEARGVL